MEPRTFNHYILTIGNAVDEVEYRIKDINDNDLDYLSSKLDKTLEALTPNTKLPLITRTLLESDLKIVQIAKDIREYKAWFEDATNRVRERS